MTTDRTHEPQPIGPETARLIAELCEALLSDLDLMRQAIESGDPKRELLERVKMMKEELLKYKARGAAGWAG